MYRENVLVFLEIHKQNHISSLRQIEHDETLNSTVEIAKRKSFGDEIRMEEQLMQGGECRMFLRHALHHRCTAK